MRVQDAKKCEVHYILKADENMNNEPRKESNRAMFINNLSLSLSSWSFWGKADNVEVLCSHSVVSEQ